MGMHKRIRPYLPESSIVCAAVFVAVTISHWLNLFIIKNQEAKLTDSSANGWIAYCYRESQPLVGEVTVLRIDPWDPKSNRSEENTMGGTITSSRIRLGGGVLTPGARFVKAGGTNVCMVDGRAMELFRPLRLIDVLTFRVWKQ